MEKTRTAVNGVVCKTRWRWVRLRQQLLLGEHDRDSVIQDALSEYQHVEDRVDIQGIKDGDGGHRVHRRDQRSKRKAGRNSHRSENKNAGTSPTIPIVYKVWILSKVVF